VKLPNVGQIESLGILFTLLPGLITYLVVRALTERGRKIDAIDAVLYGLAYTLVVHAIWYALTHVGSWIPTPDIIGLCLTAVALGIVVAIIANTGVAYCVLRWLRITSEASWSTIWQTTFREFRRTEDEYAVLHLKDRRRVMGALRGYSSEQKEGHICLERVRWLDSDGARTEQPGMHLFNAEDVAFVEFVPALKEKDDGRRKA
jgi:hypothetical protein